MSTGLYNFNFTDHEIEMLLDALDMAFKSNARMQVARPKFKAIFTKIENEITEMRQRLLTAKPIETATLTDINKQNSNTVAKK